METTDHLFFVCPLVSSIWYAIYRWLGLEVIPFTAASDHYIHHGSLLRGKKLGRFKFLVWHAVTWSLWLLRNKIIFQGESYTFSGLLDIKIRSWNWLEATKVKSGCSFAEWCFAPMLCLLSEGWLTFSFETSLFLFWPINAAPSLNRSSPSWFALNSRGSFSGRGSTVLRGVGSRVYFLTFLYFDPRGFECNFCFSFFLSREKKKASTGVSLSCRELVCTGGLFFFGFGWIWYNILMVVFICINGI